MIISAMRRPNGSSGGSRSKAFTQPIRVLSPRGVSLTSVAFRSFSSLPVVIQIPAVFSCGSKPDQGLPPGRAGQGYWRRGGGRAGQGRATGGGGGIRTRERLSPLPVFKTGAFSRSATPPHERL